MFSVRLTTLALKTVFVECGRQSMRNAKLLPCLVTHLQGVAGKPHTISFWAQNEGSTSHFKHPYSTQPLTNWIVRRVIGAYKKFEGSAPFVPLPPENDVRHYPLAVSDFLSQNY
jgi:hypothetical protein